MHSMLTFVIGSRAERPQEYRLARILEFYGVPCMTVRGESLSGVLAEMESVVRQNGNAQPVCALASGQAIGKLLTEDAEGPAAVDQLTRMARYLFVCDFSGSPLGGLALGSLTRGSLALGEARTGKEVTYQVLSEQPKITAEITGCTFVSSWRASDSCFTPHDPIGVATLVTAEGEPFLITYSRSEATWFLSADSEVGDLDAQAGDDFGVRAHFSQLMPVIMFLRFAFGDQIWHSALPPCANLIIDDPLLQPDYGFVNFPSLLQKADELDFTATLAFIPWNYRRSEKSTVNLFRKRADRLAICVHGCDHVASEFARTDIAQLNSAADLATRRMMTHQELTGLDFVKAMVFPQGRFSSASLLALKCNDYLAAINTHLLPNPGAVADQLTVGDFLDLAVTKYYGFPIFRRRYPESAAEYPFDLFIGKPLFLVEHHEFFREGFAKLSAVVQNIRKVAPQIRWMSASEILLKSYKLRRTNSTERECKLFSTVQIIENAEPSDLDFTMIKYEPRADLVREVVVNGIPVDFTIHDTLIKTSAKISAGASVRLELRYANNLPVQQIKRSMRTKSKVAVRRYLSEFRDNVIAKNQTVLSAAAFLKDRLS